MSYGSRKQGLCPTFLTSLRLRRITSSPSQTLRRPLARTTDDGRRAECSTLAAVRRGFVFHTSPLVRLTRPVCSEARYSSRIAFFAYPMHLHSMPPLWGFPSEYPQPVWYEKTRMVWLPDGEKIMMIRLFVLTQLTNVTDRQTHTHTHTQTDIA